MRSVSPSTVLFGSLLAVALTVATLMLITGTGDSPAADNEVIPVDEDKGPNAAAVGRAAGVTVQRTEGGDANAENEAFRTWDEIAALLDVPSRCATAPAKSAHSTIDVRTDRDSVGDLTTLFEEAWYGGSEATSERECRAVDAFRNIERACADSLKGDQ